MATEISVPNSEVQSTKRALRRILEESRYTRYLAESLEEELNEDQKLSSPTISRVRASCKDRICLHLDRFEDLGDYDG